MPVYGIDVPLRVVELLPYGAWGFNGVWVYLIGMRPTFWHVDTVGRVAGVLHHTAAAVEQTQPITCTASCGWAGCRAAAWHCGPVIQPPHSHFTNCDQRNVQHQPTTYPPVFRTMESPHKHI